MKLLKYLSAILLSFLLLPVLVTDAALAESEPETEEKLPWEALTNVEWIWEDGFYQAQFTDRQKELDGKEMVVEGFMFPLEYTRKHRNFIISASPMGNCFFCGPGEAESMVYVQAIEDVEHTNGPMKVKGTFHLVSDASQGIIYELKNATVVK